VVAQLVTFSCPDKEADLSGRSVDGWVSNLAAHTGLRTAKKGVVHTNREGGS
jgi:hypothetical protein